MPRAYNKQPVSAGFLFILINKRLISGWHAAERKGGKTPGLGMLPPPCGFGKVGLSPGARVSPMDPNPCPGLWMQLGHGPCPGEGQGIHNSLGSTYLLPSQGSRFIFPEADLGPRCTLRCWKGPREGGKEGKEGSRCSRWGFGSRREHPLLLCIHWQEDGAGCSLPKI